jgi:hypothetical protein
MPKAVSLRAGLRRLPLAWGRLTGGRSLNFTGVLLCGVICQGPFAAAATIVDAVNPGTVPGSAITPIQVSTTTFSNVTDANAVVVGPQSILLNLTNSYDSTYSLDITLNLTNGYFSEANVSF